MKCKQCGSTERDWICDSERFLSGAVCVFALIGMLVIFITLIGGMVKIGETLRGDDQQESAEPTP